MQRGKPKNVDTNIYLYNSMVILFAYVVKLHTLSMYTYNITMKHTDIIFLFQRSFSEEGCWGTLIADELQR